jgi:hypothetical protein
MSADEPKPSHPIKIDIGVGAKATLSASVSTEIPTASSGRLLDAITDMFRPFSERRGLKADQIRLQREEVLIEIAKRARARLQLEGHQSQPLPNKFLVPFLEAASLEESDSDILIERWADLLAACSLDPKSAHPRFVQILSEMTSDDAKLLRRIAHNHIDDMKFPDQAYSDGPLDFETTVVQNEIFTEFGKRKTDLNQFFAWIDGYFSCPGVGLIDAIVSAGPDDFWSTLITPKSLLTNDDHMALEVLYSLNVLTRHVVKFSLEQFHVAVYYVCMTSLGTEFMRRCDRELSKILESQYKKPKKRTRGTKRPRNR